MRSLLQTGLSIFFITTLILTGCSDSEEEEKKNTLIMAALLSQGGNPFLWTKPVAPDAEYSGSDCSSGYKTSAGGSAMSLAEQSFSIQLAPGLSAMSPKQYSTAQEPEYVPDEIIVKFKDGTSHKRTRSIMSAMGTKNFKTLFTAKKGYNSLLKRIKLKDRKSLRNSVEEYNSMPEVEYAEPNYIFRSMATPNDPNYGSLWGLHNTGQSVNGTSGSSDKDIDAPEAWDTITDCSSVIVAVLDTGINYNHRDLQGNMWNGGGSYPNHGWDYIDDDNDPIDLNGHGTHVAGTIGAYGNDSTGLTGVCWRVQLIAVRVLDGAGSGTLSDIAQGIDFAVARGAHVINMSLGGTSGSTTLSTAVTNARTAGVIIAAAAGNNGTNIESTPMYPASYTDDNILSVAAIDQDGTLPSFSNYGTTSVDIAAPGVNILSTWPGQSVLHTDYNFAGWAAESGWGIGMYNSSALGDQYFTTNPPLKSVTAYYASNLGSATYRPFDLTAYGANGAFMSFYVDCNIQTGDYLYPVYNASGQRPITALTQINGSTGGEPAGPYEFDMSSHMTTGTNIGFYLYSDGDVNSQGTYAGVGLFSITRLYHRTTACRYQPGTSMATPHVAGVAALAIAYYDANKGGYSRTGDYSKIITSIKSTNDTSLTPAGRVNGNRILNAKDTLDYIITNY